MQRLFLVPKIDFSKLFIIQLRDFAFAIYILAIVITFFSTWTAWFTWKLHGVHQFLCSFLIATSFIFSRTLSRPIFSRKDYLYPLGAFAVYYYLSVLLRGANVFGLLNATCSIIVFGSLFALERKELIRIGNLLAKTTGALLVPSIFFYLIYLTGRSLPHYHVKCPFADYSFENYTFFMVVDNDTFTLIPRFTSYFLEPAHLAMGCIVLLTAQIGQWNKWYNIALFTATLLSFSLAGYVFLAIVLVGAAWMKGKAVIGKLIALAVVMLGIGIGSMFYNQGDNLVNTLIVERLAVDSDGKMAGDNRVTNSFLREYEKYIGTSRAILGEGGDKMERFGFGNAGYRVFIYSNGLFLTVLLFCVFCVIASRSREKRARVLFWTIHLVSFIPHAFPLRFYFFTPLYVLLHRGVMTKDDEKSFMQLDEKENGGN